MWKTIFLIFFFIGLYYAAYSHNKFNQGHPLDRFKEIKINRFSKLFWFKDKQKGVVKYCYLMQLHCIIASLIYILIWSGSCTYNSLTSGLYERLLGEILGGYIVVNIFIIAGYIFWGAIDELINRKKREKKKRSRSNR
jgi:hypothetical protein